MQTEYTTRKGICVSLSNRPSSQQSFSNQKTMKINRQVFQGSRTPRVSFNDPGTRQCYRPQQNPILNNNNCSNYRVNSHLKNLSCQNPTKTTTKVLITYEPKNHPCVIYRVETGVEPKQRLWVQKVGEKKWECKQSHKKSAQEQMMRTKSMDTRCSPPRTEKFGVLQTTVLNTRVKENKITFNQDNRSMLGLPIQYRRENERIVSQKRQQVIKMEQSLRQVDNELRISLQNSSKRQQTSTVSQYPIGKTAPPISHNPNPPIMNSQQTHNQLSSQPQLLHVSFPGQSSNLCPKVVINKVIQHQGIESNSNRKIIQELYCQNQETLLDNPLSCLNPNRMDNGIKQEKVSEFTPNQNVTPTKKQTVVKGHDKKQKEGQVKRKRIRGDRLTEIENRLDEIIKKIQIS